MFWIPLLYYPLLLLSIVVLPIVVEVLSSLLIVFIVHYPFNCFIVHSSITIVFDTYCSIIDCFDYSLFHYLLIVIINAILVLLLSTVLQLVIWSIFYCLGVLNPFVNWLTVYGPLFMLSCTDLVLIVLMPYGQTVLCNEIQNSLGTTATIHQLTTMLSSSKYVLFPGHRCWWPFTRWRSGNN